MKKTILTAFTFFSLTVQADINLNDFDGKTFHWPGGCSAHIERGGGNMIHYSNVISYEDNSAFERKYGETKSICSEQSNCSRDTYQYTCDTRTGACAQFDKPTVFLLPDGNIVAGRRKMSPSASRQYWYCND